MPKTQGTEPPVRRTFPFAEFKWLPAPASDSAASATVSTFEGYMAVFNVTDSGGDVIEPGAFNKTLAELRARQSARAAKALPSGRYILPLFFGHDPDQPIGGILDAHEDEHGVYVKGELDLSVEKARTAHSGLKMGYIPGMSFGYFAIKHAWDRENRRHLKEVSVFEATITPIPMNDVALVAEVKAATGKADWPLGERDAAWDNGAAHKRIVAWATDDQGNVDTGKLKSVHFYSPEGDDAENVSEYKLLFCDVSGTSVKAIPRAIFACAGAHGVNATTGIADDEKATIRNKISAYYKRMASEFDDKTIIAPWDQDGGKALSMTIGAVKARDFSSHFAALAQSDQLQDDWADTFLAIVRAFSDLMWTAHAQANGYLPEGAPTTDVAQAAADNLSDFTSAVTDLVARSVAADFVPMLDDDGDSFEDPDDDDDCGYMSLDTRRAARKEGSDTKAGRVMSAANHKELGAIAGAMKKALGDMTAQHKALVAYHAKMSPSGSQPAAGDGDATDKPEGKSFGAGTPPRATTPVDPTHDDDERINVQIEDEMRALLLMRGR